MIRSIAALLIAGLSAVALAQAPANPPVRIRGTVEKIDGQTLTVKARSGETMTVKLADNFVVMGVAKASVADIGSGKFIGTTTVGERDGALVALEVHIFPENMRGTGEGHYDWDLRPSSKMTNANVANVVSMGKDRVLTVQYKGGEKKVLVPENAVVVSFTPTDRGELKPGAQVFVNSQRQPDGSLTAPRVNVGLKGQVPPM
ncbi:MAG TPA: hypothetical protein VKC33_07410 [Burkholderiales bacterium]|nr:hypothetical protein [Burkholderiales bacterium]